VYQLIKLLSTQDLMRQQLPVFLCAFVIAEFAYKFHSFTYECGAFLATWFALDWVLSRIRGAGAGTE
jgi:hypothetical protein